MTLITKQYLPFWEIGQRKSERDPVAPRRRCERCLRKSEHNLIARLFLPHPGTYLQDSVSWQQGSGSLTTSVTAAARYSHSIINEPSKLPIRKAPFAASQFFTHLLQFGASIGALPGASV
jgi:hypothetical protein